MFPPKYKKKKMCFLTESLSFVRPAKVLLLHYLQTIKKTVSDNKI